MNGKRYPEEFKVQAVKQVTEQGHTITSVAQRLGVTYKSLHTWIQKYNTPATEQLADATQTEEVRKLKAELRRVTQERDILKEATVFFAGESKKNTRS